MKTFRRGSERRLVDKLAPIVRIQAKEGKGQKVACPRDRLNDRVLATVQQCLAFGPACGNVGQDQGVQKGAFGAPAAIGHQVAFQKTGSDVIPLLKGTDGNLALEQGARLGRGLAAELLIVARGA